MKYFSHLNTAVTILQQYQGQQPFDGFIKHFFSQHKKYGSKDRKNISQLCYASFRTGKMLNELSIEERIITSLYLCSTSPNELLEQLRPGWTPSIDNSLLPIFPWQQFLYAGIDHEKFCKSFLSQPSLFIRLRPGKEEIVKKKLNAAGLIFKELNSNCLALDNASKLDKVININEEAVVQDYSSQRVGEYLKLISQNLKIPNGEMSLWDCCAGSGGKSIMAYDLIPNIDLTVSDIRRSILSNLNKRFTEAGIKNYHSFTTDLTSKDPSFDISSRLGGTKFNIIIADVPCTGSGTWSRTPEQLYFFDPATIEKFSKLQKQIVQRVIPALKQGGHFLYITCSVFKQENEEIVDFISSQCGLTLTKMELLKGYDLRADSMFAALFTL